MLPPASGEEGGNNLLRNIGTYKWDTWLQPQGPQSTVNMCNVLFVVF